MPDLESLVGAVELDDIVVYETHATRRDGGVPDVEPVPDEIFDEDGALPDPEWKIGTYQVQTDEVVAVRMRVDAQTAFVVATVDVGAIFLKREPFEVGEEVLDEFVQRVGAMVLMPHLRAMLHQATAAAGDPILLPLVRAQRRPDQ